MLEPFDAEFVLPDLYSQPEGSAPTSPPGPFLPPIGLPAGGSPSSQAPSPPTVAPPPDCAPNPEPAKKRGRGRPLGSKDKVKRRPPSIPFGGVVGRKDKTQRVRLYWKAPPKS
jgi:hypothetical protein